MGNKDYLRLGDYNAVCDRCSFKYKASELLEEWTGLKVCSLCWEPRHPQDFIRSKPDQQPLPWTRPEPADTFITGVCTMAGRHSYAGYGTAGCMIAGYTLYTEADLLSLYVCDIEGRRAEADYGTADCATL